MFKVGDKVYLREDSEWNDGLEENPLNVVGIVIELSPKERLNYVVDWGDGLINNYAAKDLILVSDLEVNIPKVIITEEEYHSLIEEINMLQELVAELSKEKEPEEFKPINEYTIDDWRQALKEGWVFCQRNGDLTNIMSVDSDPLTEYPVESESCWLRLNGQELFGGKYNLDIVERIK